MCLSILICRKPGERRDPPHESNKQHDHDEVGGVLGSGLMLVQAAGHKHLKAAYDGGGEHLNGAWDAYGRQNSLNYNYYIYHCLVLSQLD